MEGETDKKQAGKESSASASPSLNGKRGEKDAESTDMKTIANATTNAKGGQIDQSNGDGSQHPTATPTGSKSIEKVIGKFTTIRVKTKSVEDKLDKLCVTNGNGQASKGNQSPRPSKSIFGGHNFCMDPEQMGIRLNLMSNKNETDPEKKFLGFPITRQTPQMRLVTLNRLLSLIPSLNPATSSNPKAAHPSPHDLAVLERAQKTVTKYMGYLKASVCGEKVLNDKDLAALTTTMVKIGFISTLVMKMPLLGFEDRKAACLIWCNLLRRPVAEMKIIAYMDANPKLMLCLLDGYHNRSLALTTGTMLRECFRYEGLAKAILYSEYLYEIFEFLTDTTFDVSTDAFLTLQTLLLEHGEMTEKYLLENFEKFFTYFDQLVVSENYVTQLSSLRFLGTILLDRRLYDVMQEFIKDSSRLKRIILLMSSASPTIQTEGFHVLKVFIANPCPVPKVLSIFERNNDKLLRLLSTIDGGEQYKDSFPEEMAFVVKRLKDIGKKESGSTSSSISDANSNSTDDIQ